MPPSSLVPMKKLEWILGICVLSFGFAQVLLRPVHAIQNPDPAVLVRMARGADEGIPQLGSEFDLFRPYISPQETYSFIMDFPFNSYGSIMKQIYTAQSVLAPVLLNPKTVEKNALVYCSNSAQAQRRLKETGYVLTRPLANGKGLAVKKS